jgi:hypothetical protein
MTICMSDSILEEQNKIIEKKNLISKLWKFTVILVISNMLTTSNVNKDVNPKREELYFSVLTITLSFLIGTINRSNLYYQRLTQKSTVDNSSFENILQRDIPIETANNTEGIEFLKRIQIGNISEYLIYLNYNANQDFDKSKHSIERYYSSISNYSNTLTHSVRELDVDQFKFTLNSLVNLLFEYEVYENMSKNQIKNFILNIFIIEEKPSYLPISQYQETNNWM